MDDRRSTIAYMFTLLRGTIGWRPTLKSLVHISTIEAEYMTIVEVAKVALSLKGLVREFDLNQGGVRLHCYNQSVIYLAKYQVYHARTKHIDLILHMIREMIVTKDIILEKIYS